MSNKVAIVTGANKGLGFAIVKGLCEESYGTVYLTSRDEKRGQAACEELNKSGLTPVFHQLDVTDEASIVRFCTFIKEQHNGIDILINNAGILFLKDAKEPKVYQAEQTVKVNFFSLVKFTEAMLPLVKNGGKILNITSSSGHLSRIPSQDWRAWFNADELSWEELERLMLNYVEAVRLGIDDEEGWSDSPYVMSKVGVNAYTFMLHRKLANRGKRIMYELLQIIS